LVTSPAFGTMIVNGPVVERDDNLHLGDVLPAAFLKIGSLYM
jgi:hypothetical protein